LADLRIASEFYAELEAAGGMSSLSVASGIPVRTLENWKVHHDAGRVWDGARWVAETGEEQAVLDPVEAEI